MDLNEAERYYASIGFSRRTGFGERPALLVIDCTHGCSDPSVSSMAIAMDDEIRNIRRLLDVARSKQCPVVHTTIVYTDEHFRDGGWFIKKIPSLEALRPGAKESQIVPELAPRSGELVIEKRFPSGFYGTSLHSYLTTCRVDTVIVTGDSTSGCVRVPRGDSAPVRGGPRAPDPRGQPVRHGRQVRRRDGPGRDPGGARSHAPDGSSPMIRRPSWRHGG